MTIADRLTRAELAQSAAPVDHDPGPLEGYFFGSVGAQVRALEAENRRLRARVAELERQHAETKG